MLGKLALGMLLAWRLRSAASPAFHHATNVYESERVAVPVAVGWLRPAVLLPIEWREWDQMKLDAVLAHEGAHVRRRDGLVAILAGVNRSLLWFHPLAWWIERRLALLADQACDEASVAQLGVIITDTRVCCWRWRAWWIDRVGVCVLRADDGGAVTHPEPYRCAAGRRAHFFARTEPNGGLVSGVRRDACYVCRRRSADGTPYCPAARAGSAAVAATADIPGGALPCLFASRRRSPRRQLRLRRSRSRKFDKMDYALQAGRRRRARGTRRRWWAGNSASPPGQLFVNCLSVVEMPDIAHMHETPLLNDVGAPMRPGRIRGGPGWITRIFTR